MTIYFLTGNRDKFEEATVVARAFGIRLLQLKSVKLEIQADRLEEIALFAAKHASTVTKRKVVAEDAGFFIDALNGFPGPYSASTFKAIGCKGILRLLAATRNRRARFSAVVAYCEPGKSPVCFRGSVSGTVTKKEKGTYGFGFDPIFLPAAGRGRTFAEMQVVEKNGLSHRAKAFRLFAGWFKANRA